MSKIRIITDDLLERSQYGTIAGIFYVEINGLCFPEQDWSDFPVILLKWWIESLYRLKYEKSVELAFMDGPYYINATKISDEIVEVTGFERKEKDVPVFIEQILIRQLQQTIYRNANKVYQAAVNYGWQLDVNVDELKSSMNKYRNM